MVRPLIITPLAGAAGGVCYHFSNQLLGQNAWQKALGITLGIVIYIIGLWLGVVLGLAGTLWH